jgi:hypothetical protein
LTRHATDIWACDFFCVRTIFFQTLHVFFVMHHETRQILQVRVTRHPTADWAAQQVVDACGWDRNPPRYLIRDRDGRFGIEFDRRVQRLGVKRIRTPVRAPRANALAERRVRSARVECLDHLFIVSGRDEGSALARATLAVGGDPCADTCAHAAGDHCCLGDRLTHFRLECAHGALDLHACPPLESLQAPARLAACLVGPSTEVRKVVLEGLQLLLETFHGVSCRSPPRPGGADRRLYEMSRKGKDLLD